MSRHQRPAPDGGPGASADVDLDLAGAPPAGAPLLGPAPPPPVGVEPGRRLRRRLLLGAGAAALVATGWGAQVEARQEAAAQRAAAQAAEQEPAQEPAQEPRWSDVLRDVDWGDPVAVRTALQRAADARATELVVRSPLTSAAGVAHARCLEAAQVRGAGSRACTASYRATLDEVAQQARTHAERDVRALLSQQPLR